MKKNQILKLSGTDYKEMTKRLLETAHLDSLIPSFSHRIGIKPNLVAPSPAQFGATTHPEIVSGIIEYLQERGFHNLVILEGSWIGDKTSDSFVYCGYQTLSETYQVPLVDTQKDTSIPLDCHGMELSVCKSALDLDFLINVPVLKGHCQTRITCALKNMKGLIPNREKRRFHTMGLHRPIAHLNAALKQDFIVADNICGDLDYEEGGNPIPINCIMAARDPVLLDAHVCSLLRYSIDQVPYISLAQDLGVGSADLSGLEVIWIEGSDRPILPPQNRILNVRYAANDVDCCSACYAMLLPALEALKAEGLLDRLPCSISIGQGHRGRTGLLGVGACTSGFTFSIKGCPPSREAIYQGLKEYILSL